MQNAYSHAEKVPGVVAHLGDLVDQIFEFNEKCLGIDGRPIGLLSGSELDYALKAVKEELEEFYEAHEQVDPVAAVDAVLDLIYFSVGFLKRMGLSRQQVRDAMTAVHESNMSKKLGVQMKRGGHGVADAVKPEGWTGPEERIAKILGG